MKLYIRFEYIAPMILALILIGKSFLFEGTLNSTSVNIFITFLTLALLIANNLNFNRLLLSFFVLLPVLISFVANYAFIEIGGYNTLVLYTFTLLFFTINLHNVNFRILYRNTALLALVYIGVSLFYWVNGLQQILAHHYYIFAGPYLNQNTFSMGLLSLIAMLTYTGLRVDKKNNLIFHLLISTLFISIFLTQARAALLCSCLFLVCFYRKRLFLAIPLIGGLVTYILSANTTFYNRLYLKFTESGSSHRVDFWLNAFNDLINSTHILLFGEGSQQVSAMSGTLTLSLHNSYMNYIMSYGLPAFIALAFLIIYILLLTLKKDLYAFIIIVSMFLYGMFETVLFGGYSAIWFVLLLVFILAVSNEIKDLSTC